MNGTELEAELALLEMQRTKTAEELDLLMDQCRPHLATITETWIRREVERRIKDHAEIVLRLGSEKLKALKARVESLIASLPKVVEQETSDRNEWPHYRGTETAGYGYGKNEPFFNKAFRSIISHIGGILDEFGLLVEPPGHAKSWEQGAPGTFRYAINPGFDGLQSGPFTQYVEGLQSYRTIVEKIDAKKKEIAQAKAKDLWDSV